MNYIHPTAEIHEGVKLGKNIKVWSNTDIRENVIIGDNCIIGKGVYLDEGVVIGNNVKIQNYASIYAEAVIEDGVFIGPYVCFTNDMYPRAINLDRKLKKKSDWSRGKIVVKVGASLGAGCILLPNIEIGRFSLVGAGSVVTENVKDNALVVGVPAKFFGEICFCGLKIPKKQKIYQCPRCQYIKK